MVQRNVPGKVKEDEKNRVQHGWIDWLSKERVGGKFSKKIP